MIECIGQNSVVPDLATNYIIFRVGTNSTYPLFFNIVKTTSRVQFVSLLNGFRFMESFLGTDCPYVKRKNYNDLCAISLKKCNFASRLLSTLA